MPNTYVALRTETVAVATGTVTFDLTGISGYTDLRIVFNGGVVSGSINFTMRYNSDTATNYSNRDVTGDGSAATSHGTSNTSNILCNYFGYMSADQNTNILIDIFQYANTNVYKTNLTRSNNAGNGTAATVGLWRSTAAITSIQLIASGGANFAVGSTFSLYGIANADQGAAKATGGIITEDATYWYHTFGASSAFIPKQSLTCDVLVVAGGGGGGRTVGGGGGAGGLLGFTSQALTAISYNVTVGAGGNGSTSFTTNGTNGVDSQFGALTLVKGGGGGGKGDAGNGSTGGSGGGGGGAGVGNTSGGGITTGQGNVGFGGFPSTQIAGGGGGSGVAATNKNGGNGVSTYSSWGLVTTTGENVNGTVYYAGGGGGGTNSGAGGDAVTAGTGGLGGGAAGRNLASAGVPTAALANTGGGGGGSGGNGDLSNGGNGGSGVVIVRYAK